MCLNNVKRSSSHAFVKQLARTTIHTGHETDSLQPSFGERQRSTERAPFRPRNHWFGRAISECGANPERGINANRYEVSIGRNHMAINAADGKSLFRMRLFLNFDYCMNRAETWLHAPTFHKKAPPRSGPQAENSLGNLSVCNYW